MQYRRLVNIFEMVPPVQRTHQLDKTTNQSPFRRQPSLLSLGRGAIPNKRRRGVATQTFLPNHRHSATPRRRGFCFTLDPISVSDFPIRGLRFGKRHPEGVFSKARFAHGNQLFV